MFSWNASSMLCGAGQCSVVGAALAACVLIVVACVAWCDLSYALCALILKSLYSMTIALEVDFNTFKNLRSGPEMSMTTTASDDDDEVALTTTDADVDAGAIPTSLASACASCHRAISLRHVVFT